MCLVLGVLVYNASDISKTDFDAAEPKLSSLDFVSVALFLMSIVPLLLGLSVAGSLYKWTDWQVIIPIASGGSFLLLLICREMLPGGIPMPWGGRVAPVKPLLGLRLFRGLHGTATFGGAMFLGLLVGRLISLQSSPV